MILNKTPLSLSHVREYVKDLDENKPVSIYLKKFCKVSKEDAEKISADVRALNNLKIKEESIVKLVDLCPQDSEDIHKIFADVSLTEEETNALLVIVKKY